MTNSRAKGKRGELEAAHLLADWWRPLEPEIKFATTPNSGGWSTPAMRGEHAMAGDLMTKSKRWPFSVEVKREENWSLQWLLEGKSCKPWAWWLQCTKAADEESKVPLLLFRKNSSSPRQKEPWFVGVNRPTANGLCALGRRWQVAVPDLSVALYVYRWLDFEQLGPAAVERVARRLAEIGRAHV